MSCRATVYNPENTLDAEQLRSGTTAYSAVHQLTQDPSVMRTGAAPPDTESLEDARYLVRIHA